jgi:prophage regulatory protein
MNKQFITVDEACDIFGFSKSWLYKKIAGREIPFYKPIGRVYLKTSEIEDWINNSRIQTLDEIKKEAIQS